MLSRVVLHQTIPLVLRLQNQLHDLPNGPMAAFRPGDIIGQRLGLGNPMRHRDRDPRAFQLTQIHDIVAHVTNIFPGAVCLGKDGFGDGNFIAIALVQKINL
jgi:hypothetical protein